MNKWQKIEELINALIERVMGLIAGKAKSITPSKLKEKVSNSKDLLTTRRGELKGKLKESKEKALVSVVKAKEKADKAKLKTLETVQKAREINPKELKWAKVSAAVIAFIAPPFLKLKSWYLKLQPTQIASFVTLSTVATLASVNIYVQSNKIAEESRSPASEVVEEVDKATAISRRPAYFKKKEKQFKVTNVVLPAYVKSNGAVKKLVIDFTFESSNKYIKAFFWDPQNTHYIYDVLNSKMEPISIDFPLEDEGKSIIKEKIHKEMNLLLKRLKIQGEIKEVHIHSMIAG